MPYKNKADRKNKRTPLSVARHIKPEWNDNVLDALWTGKAKMLTTMVGPTSAKAKTLAIT
jgi:hypothetical protein